MGTHDNSPLAGNHVRHLELSEPDELLSVIPGVECSVLPTQAGAFHLSLVGLELGDMMLQTLHCSPLLCMAAIRPGGKFYLQLPYSGLESFILNGRAFEHADFGLYGEGADLERMSEQDTRSLVLSIPAERVAEMDWLRPGSRLSHAGAQDVFRAERAAWSRMAQIAESVFETSLASPATFEAEEARLSLRDCLLDATRALIGGCAPPPVESRASANRKRVINAADAYLRANLSRAIYTEELCAALGVSASRLADAFRASFGISPHRFLKMRRLAMVRAAIRAGGAAGGVSLVKTAALSHGFWHLGQFAHDYRAMYGEAPSDTRARALS